MSSGWEITAVVAGKAGLPGLQLPTSKSIQSVEPFPILRILPGHRSRAPELSGGLLRKSIPSRRMHRKSTVPSNPSNLSKSITPTFPADHGFVTSVLSCMEIISVANAVTASRYKIAIPDARWPSLYRLAKKSRLRKWQDSETHRFQLGSPQ